MKNTSHQRLILHFNIDKTIVMRDSLKFNNPDYCIREFFSEQIWGKIELNKNNETAFKVVHSELEFDKSNLQDQELINYFEFLNIKYKEKTKKEEPDEELRKSYNQEVTSKKIKHICDVIETGNPGAKFKKQFEEMRKRLRVPDKIQIDFGLKLDNTKLDDKNLYSKEEEKFVELGEDKSQEERRKIKFRRIFKNSYHKILISFFQMLQVLRKARRDYSVIFRFFGHTLEQIDEFIYEFNSFCDGNHPRYCGDYDNLKVKFDGSKGTKNFRILTDKMENVAINYRSKKEEEEIFIFETIEKPEIEIEELGDYFENNLSNIYKGYNKIYLKLMEKLAQHCSFAIHDDYPFFEESNKTKGKLMLIDPYDYDTQQIFFDCDIHKYPDTIEVIDIANKKKLDLNYCMNKFIVNVDPKKAITDPNYFINKIELCELNRINEIKSIGIKEVPLHPLASDFNLEKEIKKIPSDKYIEMTIFPLLNTALVLVDQIRPNDPISFIAHFMLKNKHTMKNLEEYLKEMPPVEKGDLLENSGESNMNEMDKVISDFQNDI